MLLSQLIIAPVLLFEIWFYLELVWRRDAARRIRAFDVAVIVVALVACMALLPLVAAHESGANDAIWRPVLSTLTTFFTFPLVLLAGLWMRPRRKGHVHGRGQATH